MKMKIHFLFKCPSKKYNKDNKTLNSLKEDKHVCKNTKLTENFTNKDV